MASTSKSFTGIAEGTYYGCVKSNDSTGLESAWVSSLLPISVDSTGPVVSRVLATTTNGIYKEAQTVNIKVEFNEIVQALGTGDIKLTLDTGVIDRDAVYVSGSGTNSLVFMYTIMSGDVSSDLNYADVSSLTLGATGAIRDALGNVANIALPATNGANSLAAQSAIVIDTAAPSSASSILFANPLASSTTVAFNWTHSNDPNFKQHNIKLCTANDCATGCLSPSVSAASPASLLGSDGSVYFACVQGEDMVGHLSAWAASSSSVQIDASAPTVTRVSATTVNGFYKSADTIDITVKFNEAVTVAASSDIRLKLETGTTDRDATYVSGSGTDILNFTYQVQAGDSSEDLNYLSTTALSIVTGSIKDAAGHDAVLTLPALNNAQSLASLKAIVIDTLAPTLPSAVAFASNLSNSTSLSVSWTLSTDDHFDQHNLKLCSDNACSLSCVSPISSLGSPAALTGVAAATYYACVQGEDVLGQKSAWVASALTATIDMVAPTVTDVTSTKVDGLYGTGTDIDITVKFSKAVNVTVSNDFMLALNTSPTRQATYISGDTTDTLTFRYSVLAGDTVADLGYAGINALVLGSGTIRDAAGNNANVTLPAVTAPNSLIIQKALVVDTIAPSSPLSVGFAGTLVNSASFDMSWGHSTDTHFSTHHVKLCTASDCTTGCLAAATSVTSPLTVSGTNGSTYYGCVQGEDLLGLKSPWVSSALAVTIDSSFPTVTNVSSAATDGAYKVGAIIPIVVTFSKAVYLSNPSQIGILLETGTTDRQVIYSSGDGTNALTFNYTVQAGDTSADLNYESINALTLGVGGLIKDLAGSDANRTLPALNAAQSIALQKAIVIDTTVPAAPAIVSPANGSYNPAAITVVSGTAETGATVSITLGGSLIGSAVAAAGNWSITLGTSLFDGTYSLTAKAVDPALNESVVSAASAFIVDTSGPNIPVINALVSPNTDSTPAVTGTSEAGVTINFYSNSVLLGTSTSGALTTWAYNPSAFADGNYTFTATATDAAGRVSSPSLPVIYSVDTTTPTLPGSPYFAGTITNSTSIPLTWTNSTDAHFKQHNAKLCTNAACNAGCISETVEISSPTSLLGVNAGVYYGCVQGEDDLGQKSLWVATPATIQVDSTEATVSSVTSSTADGFYTTAATISISVIFSKPVNVTVPGSLRLKLETGATDNDATYVSGSGTDTLLFTYTVQALDASNDLNYFSATALSLNGGTIKDLASNNANLNLPSLGSSNALAGAKAIRLDTTAPTAASSVGFASTIGNSLSFPMTWAAGTDANLDHYNTKICTDTGCSLNCTSIGTSTALTKTMTGVSGSAYYGCVQTVDAVNLTSAWTNSVSTMTIDTTVPTVVSVTSSLANGSYKLDQVIPIQITFSENVLVTHDATNRVSLKLETGATDRDVLYSSGSGTSVLTFEYTVQATDTSADLNYFDINSLTLAGTAAVKDNAGSAAVLTLPATGNGSSLGGSKAIVIDTTAPLAPSIVTPANLAYSMTNVTTISGTSEANASITLKNGATTIGTTTASGTNWSIILNPPGLSDGSHNLSAIATDLAGNASSASTTNVLTVDTSAPTAPVINAMTSPNTDDTPTVSGTSEPNMAIKIYANTIQVGTATANASGNWTTVVSSLADGTYSITATATDPGPRTSVDSAARSYSVDTTNPTVPSAVTFSSAYSQSTSLGFSWTAGSDVNLSGYKAKLCTANDCSTACTADTVVATTSTSITGTNGTTYFACVQSTDSLGHVSAWVPSTGTSKVDQTVPVVSGVSATTADGWYTNSNNIDITVTFSETVNVGNTSNLGLTLATTPTNRVASYLSGHGTSTLTFRYAVQIGDTSADLDYLSTTALTRVSTGTIKDFAGNDATLTLPSPGASGSLGFNKAIVIDTTTPVAPGAPTFTTTSTNQTVFAMSWTAGSDTNFYQYGVKICPTTDCTAVCVDPQVASGLTKNFTGSVGATYYGCAQTQDKALNVSAWSRSALTITVDQTAPTITNITSNKANGSYTTGTLIPVSVTFSKSVDVLTPGQLALLMETGTTDRTASYSTGSGTDTLIFNYTVTASDTAADLGPISLSVGSGSIRDTAGNNASLTIPADAATYSMRFQKAIVVDTTAPAAPVISTPANNAYVTTNLSTLSGTAEANATVTVYSGATSIGTATATSGGAWTMTLGTPLSDGSYSLTAKAKDAATNESTASATNAIVIDTSAPTTITLAAFTSPTKVNTQAFTGTAEPNMGVKVYQGSTEIASTTSNGSGNWSVSPSALADGTYIIKAQAVDQGGRISSLTAGRTLIVDTVAPTVVSVTSSLADGTYGIGQVVPVSVTFSETVEVSVTPQLLLKTGSTNTSVNVVTGAAGATRVFNYTVASGNSSSDLDYVATNSLSAGFQDAAGNAAVATLPAPGATNSLGANKAIVIDAVVATVSSVTSNKANGVYGPGNSMQIQMNFSRAVTVTGTPLLALNTTGATANATYSSGSGSTTLVFDYTVASPAKSLDLDYASTSALTAGTIKDSVGNDADRTLPTTGSANSIGGSKNIEIAGDSNVPVLSATATSLNAIVGTAITAINVSNNTGNDNTNDGRALTYSCRFDNTVNGTMDAGDADCTTIPGLTFSTSTGVINWTPTNASQSATDTAKNFEFRIWGASPANVYGTLYITAKLIRPWVAAFNYDAGTASSYAFDSSLINHTGGTVSLIAKDQLDGQYDSDWQGAMGGVERKGAPYDILKLGLNAFCGGHGLNCYGPGDASWLPKTANRVKFIDFGGSATTQFPGMTQPASNMPVESTAAQKTGWTSYYFDGNDFAYHSRPVTDDFTINIWILTTSSVATGDCTAFHHGAAIVSGEVGVLTNDFGMALCDGYVIVGTGNSTTPSEKSIRSKYRHNDNVWHMLTFTRTKSTGVFKLYVDGIFQGSDSNGNNSLNAPGDLYYGRHYPGSVYYVGNMDEGTFWNTALSDSEVSLVFDRQNPRGSGLYESRIMDAGYAAAPWDSITVATNQANGKELPDASLSETTAAYPTMSANLMSGNKGLWHLNETSGNYIDRSGSGAHAANSVSSTTGSSGKFARSAYMNGAGQHINLGNNGSSSFGAGSFSSSMWFRTPKALGAGTASRIFSNGYYGVTTGWFVRIYEKYLNFGVGCTGSAANCINVQGTTVVTDNQWHHVVTIVDRTSGKVKVFLDGAQETISINAGGTCGTLSGKDLNMGACTSANADRSISYAYFGTHDNATEFYEGYLDEAAIWNRALTDAEAVHLYKRGGTRLLVQVKTCANPGCTDDPTNTAWKGPDGTMQTYFSELNNNGVPASLTGAVSVNRLTINFADYGLNMAKRYLQYRLILESDDRKGLCNYGSPNETCSPEVIATTAGPDHYPVSPPIVFNGSLAVYNFNALTETLGGMGCSEGVKYQLSANNSNWYYHNGTTWVLSNGSYSQANTNPYLSTKASEFLALVGRGSLYIKVFLGSSGISRCEIDSIGLSGNTSY